jgi:SPP1 gp7 family putative phage head morphogenesis protein
MPVTIEPLAPAEAINYWKGKAPVSTADFERMDTAARSRAFAVSGLAKMDQVGSMHAAIGKAIENGETLADFKGRIGDIIDQQGWTGKKAWRVENIFRTNVQSAYMAGRYQQMKRVAKSRPYWMLVAVRDRRTRQTHLAVDGLVYPYDHPFWQTWYPPNGFACRCVVVTLSERQVKSRGLKVQTEIPDTIRVIDPETGMESFVTPIPDKGWATNVGEDWMSGLAPSELDSEPVNVSAKALCRSGDHAAGPVCRPPLTEIDRRHIVEIDEKHDLLSKNLSKEEHVLAFLKEFGLRSLSDSKLHTVQGGYPVVINQWLFKDKSTGEFKRTWSDKGPYMKLLARTIQNPYEVWWQPVEIGKNRRTVYALRMIRMFAQSEKKDIGGYCSFSLLGRHWHGATTFMPKAGRSEKAILEYLERQRGGILVYREQL